MRASLGQSMLSSGEVFLGPRLQGQDLAVPLICLNLLPGTTPSCCTPGVSALKIISPPEL